MAVSMKNPEEIEDPQVWVNCARCTGCFSGQYGRVRPCVPTDAPRPGNGPLHPPLAERPVAPDPYEAVKQEICAAYLAGKNLVAIAYDLNSRGVPTRHAKTWHASTVLKIILQMPRALRMKRDV
jgi:hypothetical protein